MTESSPPSLSLQGLLCWPACPCPTRTPRWEGLTPLCNAQPRSDAHRSLHLWGHRTLPAQQAQMRAKRTLSPSSWSAAPPGTQVRASSRSPGCLLKHRGSSALTPASGIFLTGAVSSRAQCGSQGGLLALPFCTGTRFSNQSPPSPRLRPRYDRPAHAPARAVAALLPAWTGGGACTVSARPPDGAARAKGVTHMRSSSSHDTGRQAPREERGRPAGALSRGLTCPGGMTSSRPRAARNSLRDLEGTCKMARLLPRVLAGPRLPTALTAPGDDLRGQTHKSGRKHDAQPGESPPGSPQTGAAPA